jgi:hypothetical protein
MVTALAVAAVVVAYWATAPPAMVAAVAGLVVAYWATAPPAAAIQSRAGPVVAGAITPAARVRAVWAILGAFAGPSRAPP